jgi:hypothetical protein
MRIGKRHGDDRVLCDAYDCHSARTRGARASTSHFYARPTSNEAVLSFR